MTGPGAARVTAIIPTLGTDLPRLRRCIDALRSQMYAGPPEIVVVLNTPEPPAWPSDLADVMVLRPGMNLGWAGGLAYGRSTTSAEHLWLVQDDMEAMPGCLDALVTDLADRPDHGLVSPVVVGDDGLIPAHSCGGWVDPGPPAPSERHFPEQDTPVASWQEPVGLDYVASRGMLVRSSAWDAVGGMYAGFYPVQWVDVSFCAALRQAGIPFALTPNAHVRHAARSSTPSAYAHFLFARHRELYWRLAKGPGFVTPASDPPIPVDVLQAVAAGATSLCSDLSRAYVSATQELDATHKAAAEHAANMQVEQVKAMVAAAEARAMVRTTAKELKRAKKALRAVHASRSWRLTAPARALARRARRRG